MPTTPRILKAMAAFLAFLAFCSIATLSLVDRARRVRNEMLFEVPPEFCQLSDEVYQAISANLENWIKVFRLRSQSGTTELGMHVLKFSTSANKEYIVNAQFWDMWVTPNMTPVLFVQVHGWSWQGPLGQLGYVYSPSEIRSIADEYNLTAMDESIYCYQRKNGN